MTIIRAFAALALIALVALALGACRTSGEGTYDFDPAAHQRATELKSRAVALVANSGEAYSRHRADVEAVSAAMSEAFALSAATADNEVIAGAWSAMKDPFGDLFGGYVRRWQASGAIAEAAREAATAQIVAHFDYILCLEAARRTRGGLCAPPGAEADGAVPAAEDAAAEAPAG